MVHPVRHYHQRRSIQHFLLHQRFLLRPDFLLRP